MGVVVLNDAAHLNVREGEGLGKILQALGFGDGLIEGLALKIGDGAVRPDGASFNADNILNVLAVFNLDVGVFTAFLGEDLDADVIFLSRCAAVVVAVDLAVKDYSRGAGSLRLRGHLEFVGRDGLEADSVCCRGEQRGPRDNCESRCEGEGRETTKGRGFISLVGKGCRAEQTAIRGTGATCSAD
jgi:hypothetical protein